MDHSLPISSENGSGSKPAVSSPSPAKPDKPFCLPSCFASAGDLKTLDSSAAVDSGGGLRSNAPYAWLTEIGRLKPHHRRHGSASSAVVGGGRRRRRHHSADLQYDALSYALNFDEGEAGDDAMAGDDQEYRYRNFSARLPASPLRPRPERS